ncbi:hypothetical protein H8K35_10395 [Undibacterium sp. LX40W]|uniref:Uncharacterized protein n=1 Tax=Undibacterium nitidum TaxID=2762298 RepID=A0A923HLP3_9BURK|nr:MULTISPECIES: hypothetical protein [Undibacterium]MBC3881935.1 hypothetical protein [Undibacterium nitidum]MBC3892068.1 hypothetical protein [Undibacterium sp. LX40W]
MKLITTLFLLALSACTTPEKSMEPRQIEPAHLEQVTTTTRSAIDVTVAVDGKYVWRGKAWLPQELEATLIEEKKKYKIEEIRLCLGGEEMTPQHLVDIFLIAEAIGVKAFYEREDGFKSIKWGK